MGAPANLHRSTRFLDERENAPRVDELIDLLWNGCRLRIAFGNVHRFHAKFLREHSPLAPA
jgi:hypothetical protein